MTQVVPSLELSLPLDSVPVLVSVPLLVSVPVLDSDEVDSVDVDSVDVVSVDVVVASVVVVVDESTSVVGSPCDDDVSGSGIGVVGEFDTIPSVSSGHAQLFGSGLSQRGSRHATMSVSAVAADLPHAITAKARTNAG